MSQTMTLSEQTQKLWDFLSLQVTRKVLSEAQFDALLKLQNTIVHQASSPERDEVSPPAVAHALKCVVRQATIMVPELATELQRIVGSGWRR
jgi:hypothetical protein